MPVVADTHSRYRGLQVLLLENHHLRVTVLPELGAKVWDFVHTPTDRNWLRHNPRVEPRPVPFGAGYDDNWAGGWDELFPNDEPVRHAGEAYPDHGELWCQPWEWEIARDDDQATLHLWRCGAVTPTRMEKWITLRDGESCLRFRHRLENLGHAALEFLWKPHPALNVSEQCRLDAPLGRVLVPAGYRGRLGETVTEFTWPIARDQEGRAVDMRRVLPRSAGQLDFWYGVELRGGWCAVTDQTAGAGFGLAFPREVFSTLWLFASYGGWRDLYVIVPEPCDPLRLDEAARSGRCGRLGPGEVLEAEVTAVAYTGLACVEHVDPDGSVRGPRIGG